MRRHSNLAQILMGVCFRDPILPDEDHNVWLDLDTLLFVVMAEMVYPMDEDLRMYPAQTAAVVEPIQSNFLCQKFERAKRRLISGKKQLTGSLFRLGLWCGRVAG